MDDSVEIQEDARRRSTQDIQSSPSAYRRRSIEKPLLPPTVLVHSWLLSFSHYIALYTMLVARLGTRSDCRKLRAKSEVVRRRSVNYARKCHESLLPVIVDCLGKNYSTEEQKRHPSSTGLLLPSFCEANRVFRRSSKKSNIEDNYRLFFLYCTCLEFFIEQLLRTAQLFHCFSLNIGRSLTSSLVAPPPNFIYSGLAEVERPRKKHSKLLPHRNCYVTSTFFNDSLSGNDFEMQPKVESNENHAEESSADGDVIPVSKRIETINSCRFQKFFFPQWLYGSQKKNKMKCESSFFYQTPASSSQPPPCQVLPRTKLVNSSLMFPHSENRKKVMESDTECFEMLIEDIKVVKDMIMEIHTNISINPWSIIPCKRKLEHQADQEENMHLCHNPPLFVQSESDLDELIDDEDENAINDDTTHCLQKNREIGVHRDVGTKTSYNFTSEPLKPESYISSLSCWRRRLHKVRISSQTLGKKWKCDSDGDDACEVVREFEEKSQEDDEIKLSKRLRRNQYICLSLIIVFAIGLFGSALGSCIYLLT